MKAVVTTVCLIYGISADSKTCCYGSKCPLPVFNQFNGNYSLLKSFGAIDESACCPKGCWFSSGSIDTITVNGTVDTSCICNCDQDCNTVDGLYCYNGFCSGFSGSETCDQFYSSNHWGCPDSHTDNIDITGAAYNSGMEHYCTYNRGTGYAPMTQRCLPTTICVENGVFNGTYVKNGFHNGFPNYIGDNFMIRVESNYSVWLIVRDDGTLDTLIFPYCYTDFNDITSLNYTKCPGGKDLIISRGQCIYPTPEPTAYEEYNTPSPTSVTSQDMNSNESSQNDLILIVAVIAGAFTLFVLIVAGIVFCAKMRKRNIIITPYVKMEPIQHQPKDNNNSSNIIIITQEQQEPEEDDEKQLEGKQENQDVSHSEQQ